MNNAANNTAGNAQENTTPPIIPGTTTAPGTTVAPAAITSPQVLSVLRPVEALYLMDFAGHEQATLQATLTAAMAYLIANGYVKASANKFSLTQKGMDEQDSPGTYPLRKYETDIIGCIRRNTDYGEGLVWIIKDYDFTKDLCDEGYLVPKTMPHTLNLFWLWPITWHTTHYEMTLKGYDTINALQHLKAEIEFNISTSMSIDFASRTMAYALPSLVLTEKFTSNENSLLSGNTARWHIITSEAAQLATSSMLCAIIAVQSTVNAINAMNNAFSRFTF